MALLSLIDNLTHALENGEYIVGVYLDFPKAFDTVDHMILLQKLYHCSVSGRGEVVDLRATRKSTCCP